MRINGINIVIDSGATDQCFVDMSIFIKYKKFIKLLARRIVEK